MSFDEILRGLREMRDEAIKAQDDVVVLELADLILRLKRLRCRSEFDELFSEFLTGKAS